MKRVTIQLEVVRELMRRADALMKQPGKWVQGTQAQTAAGENTAPEAADAAQWCCLGALRHEALLMVGGRFEGPARDLYDAATRRMAESLVEQLGCRRVSRNAAIALADWQDSLERTQEQVSDLFVLAA